jgi:hypothetical protein
MTQYRLAFEARVDTGHLSRFMNGKVGLRMAAFDRIGEVLGLRIIVAKKRRR